MAQEKTHNLHTTNLLFERGHHIALIGKSGSGTSALMAVLRGLYKAQPAYQQYKNVDFD